MIPGTPDLEGLRRFVAGGDRSTPTCFAGRQAIIDAIAGALDTVMDGAREDRDARGLTRLVQGAPGAGKTALLEEVAGRFQVADARRRPGDAQGPVPVMLDRDMLYSEEDTVLAIVEAMAGSAGWTVKLADFRRTSTRGAGGGLRLPPLLSAAVRLGSSVARGTSKARLATPGLCTLARPTPPDSCAAGLLSHRLPGMPRPWRALWRDRPCAPTPLPSSPAYRTRRRPGREHRGRRRSRASAG